MDRAGDPFIALAAEVSVDGSGPPGHDTAAAPALAALFGIKSATAPAVGRLHGFDLLDRPLIACLTVCPGEILPARTTLPLRRAMIGSDVVLLFEGGDPRAPIIMGVIEGQPLVADKPVAAFAAAAQVDGERQIIEAEREIVLRSGDASITLTRAGKVIIKGNYIVSRSTGYNKVKGAAIELN